MLEPEKLRKADLATGLIFVLLGLWIIIMALQMPMKDSYGGVQNVWYVSPALFPLCVGGAIALLGLLLVGIRAKQMGTGQLQALTGSLLSGPSRRFKMSGALHRFFAIVGLLLVYVYIHIPSVDFLICTTLFLTVSILVYYFDDNMLLRRLMRLYYIGSLPFVLFFIFGRPQMDPWVATVIGDIYNLLLLAVFIMYARLQSGRTAELKRRLFIGLVTEVAVPLILCPVFKYFLLVPLPTEGILVTLMDNIYYAIF